MLHRNVHELCNSNTWNPEGWCSAWAEHSLAEVMATRRTLRTACVTASAAEGFASRSAAGKRKVVQEHARWALGVVPG